MVKEALLDSENCKMKVKSAVMSKTETKIEEKKQKGEKGLIIRDHLM